MIAHQYQDLNAGRALQPRPAKPRPSPPAPRRRSPLVGPDPRRFLTLVRTLALASYKLKYSGTVLNYLWALARPLALFSVLLLFFSQLGIFNSGVRHYPVYLLMGVVLWMFFVQTTSGAVHSLVDQAPLLRKLPFPRLAIPLSVVLTALFDLCVNFTVLLVLALGFGIAPRVGWLELLPLVALLAALTTGVSLLLSALYVRYRDVDEVWLVASQAVFYLTPIFYVSSLLPRWLERPILLLNPLATVITEARHVFVDPDAPTAAAAAGGYAFLLIPVTVAAGCMVLGLWVFSRESDAAAENV